MDLTSTGPAAGDPHPAKRSVVVGVDDSPAADRALSWAAPVARDLGLPVTVLHATRAASTAFASQPGLEHGATLASLRARGRQVTTRAARTLRSAGFDGDIRERLRSASPVHALAEASADAELVVVGARAAGPLGTFVLGSVRRGLVGRSRCPVVAVPGAGDPSSTRGVLVALDDRHPDSAVLDLAYRFAQRTAAPVTVLGCLLTPAGVYAGPGELDRDDPDAERERRRLHEAVSAHAVSHPEVLTRVEVDRGPVDEAVVRAARDHELVVLGSHTHSLLTRVLARDVDRWVVTHAPCPVVVVPQDVPQGAAG